MELTDRKIMGMDDKQWTICSRTPDGSRTKYYLFNKRKKDGFISSLFPVCITEDYACFLFDQLEYGMKVWRRLVITPDYEAIEEVFEPFGAVPKAESEEKKKLKLVLEKLQEASAMLQEMGV